MQLTAGLVLCSFLVLSSVQSDDGAKILAIFPFPGPSQYILVQPYLKELAGRGHNVTVISAFPQNEAIKNFRDIPAPDIFKSYNDFIRDVSEYHWKWSELSIFSEFFVNVTLNVFENEEVQQMMNSEEKFDLIVIEALMIDALYGFAQHYNAPIIGVSSFGTDPIIDELVGNTSPISYLPLATSSLPDRMNFWQRLHNVYLITLEKFHAHWVHLPKQVKIYEKYFPQAKINLMEMRKNFSLILLNQHFALSCPRPYVPAMIEVGGFQINHIPQPLPKDMESFLNASREDVIYFAMGTNVKSKNFPKNKLEILMNVFASLPYRVLFKYEDSKLPVTQPNNVFISPWFPQSDILAHPKVKLFITHGGLLGTTESIYHGKPVIGIPFFYDQFLNVERAVKAGFGQKIDFNALNEVDFRNSIQRAFSDRKYQEVAAAMSKRYRDQPIAPRDTAIYWTEYVLRHGGAKHLRVVGLDLNFIQYHSLDTFGFVFGVLGIGLAITIGVASTVARTIFPARPQVKTKSKYH